VLAFAGLAWGLVTFIAFNNLARQRKSGATTPRHLFVLLDVSPSMLLADAGEGGTMTRNARATQVIKSVLDRVPGDDVRFSAAGFYTEMRMLVKECQDRELILHLTGGIPFHITYKAGKTDILASINQAQKIMEGWPPKSATLLVVSDGDSVLPTGLKPMPSSVAEVLFAGVGDPRRGAFIDGHLSRQDAGTLTQLARRLNGKFFDCNTRHLPSDVLGKLNSKVTGTAAWRTDRRLVASIVLAASASCLCLVPLLLEYLGSGWNPRRRFPHLQPEAVR
jgi:Ca-activated chloride channel family protein